MLLAGVEEKEAICERSVKEWCAEVAVDEGSDFDDLSVGCDSGLVDSPLPEEEYGDVALRKDE